MYDALVCFLGSSDLDRTHQFYAGLLGLPLDRDQGSCRIYRVASGGMIGFCRHLNVNPAPRSPIITLVSDQVDEVYQRLLAAGVSVEHPPAVNPRFNIYHFFVNDPDGYSVEVQRFFD